MLRLQKHLLPLLRAASPLPSALHHHERLLLLSSSTSTSPASFFLEDYLVSACGLAPAQARKASKKALDQASKASKASKMAPYSRLNSTTNPDAVLALLSGVGLSRADIAAVVAADPLILRSRVKSIGPRLVALRDRFGLSATQIGRFLVLVPSILRLGNIDANLEFLIPFYGSFEKVLVAAKRCNSVLTCSLERVIKPNIALFLQCGLSARDMAQLCTNAARVLASNPERVKALLLRAEELGVPRTSRMFKYAVAVVAGTSEDHVAAKLEFLKRNLVGCSEAEVAIAVSKNPIILGLSTEYLLRKIEFLINEVGIEPRYIVERPCLFSYSLEKRMIPRRFVMKVLQAKGLLNSNMTFSSLASLGEKTFRLKFIDCHKDRAPWLADAYAAACAGDMTPQV